MLISVILSTYNSPVWLTKVLWGYAAQSHRAFEVVIADDGSDEAVAECIRRLRRATQLRIQHVWQPRDGFGKCRVLNHAIMAAEADYVVFSDGDCIPRRDFLAQHAQLAARGCFLSGGVVRLPFRLSEKISQDDIITGRAISPGWLIRNGLSPSRKLFLLLFRGSWAAIWDALTTTRPTFNGHNASAWKCDLWQVNGFDERMGYGGLDRELGERLCNAGVRPKQIRHRAVCVHLDHRRAYVDAAVLLRNRQIREDTRRHRFTWTPYGICQPEETQWRIIGADGTISRPIDPSRSSSRVAA